MAVNKVTIDGTTRIDLSMTGIETAADIPAGKYGYLRTGERVLGTGGNINPLSGKILAVTGDSICAGAGYTGGYAKIIGDDYDMTVQNIAVGGGTVVNSGSNIFCISESIPYLRSDADYILLEGGGNDADANIPLGTLTTGYSDTLDTTTFAGAFEQMLKSTVARFPNKKIGYILIHKCAWQFDSRVPNSYYDIVINACKKWGIPYLDLNTQVPPLGYIADLESTYTANADGYHPNELGYRTFYVPKIVEFMKTMLTDNSMISKTITENGTYLASNDNVDGYSSVSVSVPNAISITEVANTTGTTVIVTGTEASDSSAYQIATGTVVGNGTNILQIPCEFEPDLIRIYGDLSADVENRGAALLTIIKDMDIYYGADTSTSASVNYFDADLNITGYNESNPSSLHATYSNNTLSIDTVVNSGSRRWLSGVTYEYKLIKFGSSQQ